METITYFVLIPVVLILILGLFVLRAYTKTKFVRSKGKKMKKVKTKSDINSGATQDPAGRDLLSQVHTSSKTILPVETEQIGKSKAPENDDKNLFVNNDEAAQDLAGQASEPILPVETAQIRKLSAKAPENDDKNLFVNHDEAAQDLAGPGRVELVEIEQTKKSGKNSLEQYPEQNIIFVPSEIATLPVDLYNLPNGVIPIHKNSKTFTKKQESILSDHVKAIAQQLPKRTDDDLFRNRLLAHVIPVLYIEDQEFDAKVIRSGLMAELLEMEQLMLKTIVLVEDEEKKQTRSRRVKVTRNWIALCAFAAKFRDNSDVKANYGPTLHTTIVSSWNVKNVKKTTYPRTVRIFAYLYMAAGVVELYLDSNALRTLAHTKQKSKYTFYDKEVLKTHK
jgi:hypothetical protein